MATPPTRVTFAAPSAGNFSAVGASKVSTAFDVVAGDLLVIMASVENALTPSAVTPTASGGALANTTLRASQNAGGGNQSAAYCWTADVGATATGITVTVPRPTSDTTLWWGMSATLWRNHGGIGTTFSANNGTATASAPSIAGAAACAANSAAQIQINDWNAADGTTRTWRTINGAAEVESTYFRDAAHHAVYGGFRADTGAAGTVTQGLTAPTGMRWVAVGVEILGTGGGGGGTTAPTRPRFLSPVPSFRASTF